jgi:hypothetical protein
MTIQHVQIVDVDVLDIILPGVHRIDPRTNLPNDRIPILFGTSTNERKLCQIPRQPNSAADDNVGIGPGTAKPLTTIFS